MRRWIVRTLVVAAVVGSYAVGHGLGASAEVPVAQVQKKAPGRFRCAQSRYMADVEGWLSRSCDPARDFTVTFVPTHGAADLILACCVAQ